MRCYARLEKLAKLRFRICGKSLLVLSLRNIRQREEQSEDDDCQNDGSSYENNSEHNLLYTHEVPLSHDGIPVLSQLRGCKARKAFRGRRGRVSAEPGLESTQEANAAS